MDEARERFDVAAHRNPAAAAIFLSREYLRCGVERGLDRFRRQARRPYRYVRRPAVGDAAPQHRARLCTAPQTMAPSRRRSCCLTWVLLGFLCVLAGTLWTVSAGGE
jgi:hypothetical protein